MPHSDITASTQRYYSLHHLRVISLPFRRYALGRGISSLKSFRHHLSLRPWSVKLERVCGASTDKKQQPKKEAAVPGFAPWPTSNQSNQSEHAPSSVCTRTPSFRRGTCCVRDRKLLLGRHSGPRLSNQSAASDIV